MDSLGNCPIDRIRILGIELELACTRGLCGEIFSHANSFNIFPRKSLHCKLDPVQYREYEYDLFLNKVLQSEVLHEEITRKLVELLLNKGLQCYCTPNKNPFCSKDKFDKIWNKVPFHFAEPDNNTLWSLSKIKLIPQ